MTAAQPSARGIVQDMGESYDKDRLEEMAREVLQNAKVVQWFVRNGNIKILPYQTERTQT